MGALNSHLNCNCGQAASRTKRESKHCVPVEREKTNCKPFAQVFLKVNARLETVDHRATAGTTWICDDSVHSLNG